MSPAVNKITPAQNMALLTANKERLAQWWCELNHWGWPHDLPDPDNESPENYVHNSVRSQIMRMIENKVSHDYCLEVWNKDRYRKTQRLWDGSS